MTAPKDGDRIRVEVEGVVEYERMDDLLWVRVDGKGTNHIAVSPAVCTVLAQPIKEGDVITDVAQLDGLPFASIIATPGYSPALKAPEGWITIGGVRRLVDEFPRTFVDCAVVLRIGNGLT